MDLRTDDRQFVIYDPNTVTFAFQALDAAAIVMFGAWLERQAALQPSSLGGNMGVIGKALSNIGEARQQINAGLAPNDVPDELAYSQRMWDVVSQWNQNPGVVNVEEVGRILDQFAGAMAYLNQRTMDTGTNHPRWNSRIVSGQPCEECGR
jgi:hypothetical protein